jgi:hypothetical protein
MAAGSSASTSASSHSTVEDEHHGFGPTHVIVTAVGVAEVKSSTPGPIKHPCKCALMFCGAKGDLFIGPRTVPGAFGTKSASKFGGKNHLSFKIGFGMLKQSSFCTKDKLFGLRPHAEENENGRRMRSICLR